VALQPFVATPVGVGVVVVGEPRAHVVVFDGTPIEVRREDTGHGVALGVVVVVERAYNRGLACAHDGVAQVVVGVRCRRACPVQQRRGRHAHAHVAVPVAGAVTDLVRAINEFEREVDADGRAVGKQVGLAFLAFRTRRVVLSVPEVVNVPLAAISALFSRVHLFDKILVAFVDGGNHDDVFRRPGDDFATTCALQHHFASVVERVEQRRFRFGARTVGFV
jgi:hypothetical protein